MHPLASSTRTHLASTVFRQSTNSGVGGKLLHVKAEDVKLLESMFDLESSLCCLSISWPKMSISKVNFILTNEGTLGQFFGSRLFIS